jgi:hypothetical protein
MRHRSASPSASPTVKVPPASTLASPPSGSTYGSFEPGRDLASRKRRHSQKSVITNQLASTRPRLETGLEDEDGEEEAEWEDEEEMDSAVQSHALDDPPGGITSPIRIDRPASSSPPPLEDEPPIIDISSQLNLDAEGTP